MVYKDFTKDINAIKLDIANIKLDIGKLNTTDLGLKTQINNLSILLEKYNSDVQSKILLLDGRVKILETKPVEIPSPVEIPMGAILPQQWTTGTGTASNPWANDCIKKAYDACPAGGTIYLGAGYYQLAGQLTISKQINIIGEGINKTIIKTANANGFYNTADYVTIKNLMVDGVAQTDGAAYLSPITLDDCDYAVLENIEVKNAGYYGINPYEVNHSLFQNIHAHDNYRHGIHPGSDTAGRNKYNTYRTIYAWNNGDEGFDDRGSTVDPEAKCNNIFDGIVCWDNGGRGIGVSEQAGGVISNCFSKGSGEYGFSLEGIEDFNIHDCSATTSGWDGILLSDAKNVNFTNVIVKNNTNDGIGIYNCNNVNFTSCQSYDDRGTPLQDYGIELHETNTTISLLNCKLLPNKSGDIYNPNGVVIKYL